MDEAARRSTTAKGGPRVITFLGIVSGGAIDSVILSNCVKCVTANNTSNLVLGPDGTFSTVDLLVHSWYVLETDIDIYWQQLNPRDACAADPLLNGSALHAGQCIPFFVEGQVYDGVIAIFICAGQTPPAFCDPFRPDRPEGFVRIIRKDTILLPSQTGDNVSIMSPAPAPGNTCDKGGVIPPINT